MLNNLLISNEALTGILIAAACVFGICCCLYGAFRKFTQMSWLAWQLPLAAVLTVSGAILFEKFGGGAGATVGFIVSAVIPFAAGGIVLGAGGLIRWGMHKRYQPAPTFFRVCDRILGALTAVLDLVVILLVPVSFALPFLNHVMPIEIVDIVWRMPIWEIVSPYLFDLFTVTVFILFLRLGWRVGFARTLLGFILLLATLVSFSVSLYGILGWDFLRNVAAGVAGWFPNMSPVAASLIGDAIVLFVTFLLLFVALCLIFWPLAALIRRIRYVRAVAIIDGFLLALISYAFIFALGCVFDFTVHYLATGAIGGLIEGLPGGVGGALEGITATLQTWGEGFVSMLRSAPYSRMLYDCNLFTSLIGG